MSIWGTTLTAALVALLTGLWPTVLSASPDFFRAMREDDVAEAERLLAQGVASKVLNVSLHHAVSGEMARVLLTAGADPEASIMDRNTALHAAAYWGKTGVVRELLEAGADVHAKTRPTRNTPLHATVYRGSRATPEIALMLIGAGADVHAVTRYGTTALHFAAKYGRDPAMVDLLLDAGAEPLARMTHSRRGDAGKTPLDLARKFNPRILRTDAGRRLDAATRRAGMDEPGCDGVVVQPSDTKLSYIAQRTLGKASRWKEIVELNGLEGIGYRAGDCLALP